MLLLLRRIVKVLLTNLDPSSPSSKFGLLLDELRTFSKDIVMVSEFFYKRTVQANLLKLSISTRAYPYLLLFSGQKSFKSNISNSRYHQYVKHQFCLSYISFFVFWKNPIIKTSILRWVICLTRRIISPRKTFLFIKITSLIIKCI